MAVKTITKGATKAMTLKAMSTKMQVGAYPSHVGLSLRSKAYYYSVSPKPPLPKTHPIFVLSLPHHPFGAQTMPVQ